MSIHSHIKPRKDFKSVVFFITYYTRDHTRQSAALKTISIHLKSYFLKKQTEKQSSSDRMVIFITFMMSQAVL